MHGASYSGSFPVYETNLILAYLDVETFIAPRTDIPRAKYDIITLKLKKDESASFIMAVFGVPVTPVIYSRLNI